MEDLTQTIRLAGVIRESIVDGPGIRFALFVQGCPHRCPGCHNPESHDPLGGYERPLSVLLEEIKKNPLLKGVTFSGGEPFLQPAPLAALAREIRALGKGCIVYSGYTFEELLLLGEENPAVLDLLMACDYLVDGKFILEKKTIELRFRGSSNQRIIDLPPSLASGEAVEVEL